MPVGYFFVNSPLQYLCALEASYVFGEELDKVKLIVLNTSNPSLRQLKSIIDKNIWNDIILEIRLAGDHKINIIRGINKLLRVFSNKFIVMKYLYEIKKEDYIFIGNLNDDIYAFLLEKAKCSHKVVLDDGFATLSYIKNNLKLGTVSYNPIKAVQLVQKILMPPKKIKLESLVFFSMYNKIDFQSARCNYNDFKYVREAFGMSCYEKDQLVLFIGQPLVAVNAISEKFYTKIVNSIQLYYENQGFEFEYCAHRGEDISILPVKWNIKIYNYPIEVELLKRRILPDTVISISSSALISIKIIFEERIKVVAVNPFSETSSNYLDDIYEYIQKEAGPTLVVRECGFYCN